jgi:hypothetical protein
VGLPKEKTNATHCDARFGKKVTEIRLVTTNLACHEDERPKQSL